MKGKRFKTIGTSLGVCLLIVLAAFLVFRDHYQEILSHLRGIPLWGAALLLGLAAAYQAVEAMVCTLLVRKRLPEFSFREAVEVTFLGVFGNVATLAAGSVPMQSLYLHQRGLMVGQGVGVLTLEYVFHKAAILLYAGVMLLVQGRWLQAEHPGLSRLLAAGFGVCVLIITALVLLCTWRRVLSLALRLIALLPSAGKWEGRKASWSDNLRALHREAQNVLRDRRRCLRVAALNILKLCCLCCAACAALRFAGMPGPSLWRVQLLAALMLTLASALPNVAGVGPAEFAFFLIFSPFGDYAQVSSALILYRTATYFFPFFLSIAVFLRVQGRRTAEKLSED